MTATATETPLLEATGLEIRAGGRRLIANLALELRPGDCIAILGRNGTGKTTLLHTLAGLRPPAAGSLRLDGVTIGHWSRRALARHVGIVFQHHTDEMPATVMETALLGRFPHGPPWRRESDTDHHIAEQALEAMGLGELARRDVQSLSGGERQRLALAALLAQAPRIMLLDEPGNHLDIGFQLRSLALLRDRAREEGTALLFATHDINLAARFCDQVLLLDGAGEHRLGPARDVLSEENLSRAYDCRVRALPLPADSGDPGTGFFYRAD